MKHLLAVVAICLIFFSAVAAGQFANLASANFMPPPPELPHVYIRSDGNVEPQTLPIQRVGDSYIFNGNVFNFTLEVQRGNIVLDGAGYTLQGNGSGIGIILSTIGNVTVKNLEIHSFRTGILEILQATLSGEAASRIMSLESHLMLPQTTRFLGTR